MGSSSEEFWFFPPEADKEKEEAMGVRKRGGESSSSKGGQQQQQQQQQQKVEKKEEREWGDWLFDPIDAKPMALLRILWGLFFVLLLSLPQILSFSFLTFSLPPLYTNRMCLNHGNYFLHLQRLSKS